MGQHDKCPLENPCCSYAVLVVQTQVTAKVVCTRPKLLELIDEIRGAVMIAYPMGLPAWDPVRQILEDTGNESGLVLLIFSSFILQLSSATCESSSTTVFLKCMQGRSNRVTPARHKFAYGRYL
jgi:hypothetical protein